jgi:UDP-N-acetylglucosamine 1-carboxyvinyltransferase
MLEKIKIYGNQIVNGAVEISGAKNAALPLLAASLLSDSGLYLKNVPPLVDISTMLRLLEILGVTYYVTKESSYSNSIKLTTDAVNQFIAPYEIVKKMRASILVFGPLLAKFGRCSVSLPGGCAIGARPIDLHIKGIEALGATIELKDGYVHATAKRGLKGAEFEFPIVTVTGTENVLMAATLAEGTSVLKNAAKEPEIVDLANCLNKMGANISGHGSETIIIKGVSRLGSAEHRVVSDRIETGTYAIAAGITKGQVDLIGENLRSLLPTFIEKMEQSGMIFSDIKNGLRAQSSGEILPINIETEPFPGYPTDLQAQSMSMLCVASGESNIRENIWENRLMHVAELSRMGADIVISDRCAKIKGVKHLMGAPVMATDLRASFSLILAALVADGDTVVDRVYHLDRGYCCVKEKFAQCGIVVDRVVGE